MGGYFEVHLAGPVRLVPLTEDVLTIGRAPGNEVTIDSKLVSRLHALVERFPAGWSIRDLGSKNGTTVNGSPLRAALVLRDGDRVEIGPARLVFHTPAGQSGTHTVGVEPPPPPPALTPREQEVVAVLCRPYLVGGTPFPEPPAVRAIAAELHITERGEETPLPAVRQVRVGPQRRPSAVPAGRGGRPPGRRRLCLIGAAGRGRLRDG